MKIFALLSWVLILPFYLFSSRTLPHIRWRSESRDWNPNSAGCLRALWGNIVSPLLYIISLLHTAYYVLYILYHNEAKGFIDFLYYFHCFFMITNCAKTWYAASKYFWTYFGIALRFPSASTSQPHQSIPNLHYWIL